MFTTFRSRQGLLTFLTGAALTMIPLALATVVVPATSRADECTSSTRTGADGGSTCGLPASALGCPDGTMIDGENNQCIDLVQGIAKQLQALPPPPPELLGGASVPGGIPALGTVNMPDLVLPGVGLGLVPNINLLPQVGFPTAPQLPPPPSVNPLNPLGLPPPPGINPLNPLGLPPLP